MQGLASIVIIVKGPRLSRVEVAPVFHAELVSQHHTSSHNIHKHPTTK
jgi:hypothetical protein